MLIPRTRKKQIAIARHAQAFFSGDKTTKRTTFDVDDDELLRQFFMVTCRHTAGWFKLGEDFPNPGEYNRLLLETFKKYINPVETMIKSMQVSLVCCLC